MLPYIRMLPYKYIGIFTPETPALLIILCSGVYFAPNETKMADSLINQLSSTSSLEELVNGVLTHPNFRNIVGNINSSNNSMNREQLGSNSTTISPASGLVPTALPTTNPAQELRNLFARGTSTSQQGNQNATLPRFNNRFSYQPRGRNRALPYSTTTQTSKGKPRGKATKSAQTFCREVVLLNSADDNLVVRGSKKIELHRKGNIIRAFQFKKEWTFCEVYEELEKEFPQLERVSKTPK